MRAYAVKRLVIAVATLLGMSILIFVLMRLAPGNITDIIFESAGYVDQEDKKRLEQELGIDQPLAIQYARWLADLVRGELGKSYRFDRPAWEIIQPRLPVTLELAVLSLLVSVALGVPTGVISAIRQDRPLDYLLRVLSLAGSRCPRSGWNGHHSAPGAVDRWIPRDRLSPFDNLWATSSVRPPALSRSGTQLRPDHADKVGDAQVLQEDYIGGVGQAARTRGCVAARAEERLAAHRHLAGIELAFLFGGLVVTETVFNLPGVARFLVEAILWRDYPIVQNLVMFIAIVVIVSNLVVDMLYGFLDPRVRYGD
jgi:peptide/nickel transport system permease protein